MKVYEHELGPHLRSLPKDTILIADGFSCKTQIEQATPRQALHLAQLLQMAKNEGPSGPKGDYPERNYLDLGGISWRGATGTLVLGAAGLALAGWGLRRILR